MRTYTLECPPAYIYRYSATTLRNTVRWHVLVDVHTDVSRTLYFMPAIPSDDGDLLYSIGSIRILGSFGTYPPSTSPPKIDRRLSNRTAGFNLFKRNFGLVSMVRRRSSLIIARPSRASIIGIAHQSWG